MTKIKTRILASLAICTLALLVITSTLTASAITVPDATSGSASPTQESAVLLDSTPNAPTLIVEKYNTSVLYKWRVGNGGDQLLMSSNYFFDYLNAGTEFSEIAQIRDVGSKLCEPQYRWAKSYSSTSNTYSNMASTERIVWTSENTNIVYYGEEAKYDLVGEVQKWKLPVGTTVPTKYDQEYFIWNHNSNSSHYIKGTLNYNGKLADIEVKITFIGYNTSSVTIDGVKFDLRTGPNRCSLRASQAISASDINFQFGIS